MLQKKWAQNITTILWESIEMWEILNKLLVDLSILMAVLFFYPIVSITQMNEYNNKRENKSIPVNAQNLIKLNTAFNDSSLKTNSELSAIKSPINFRSSYFCVCVD